MYRKKKNCMSYTRDQPIQKVGLAYGLAYRDSDTREAKQMMRRTKTVA